MAQDPEPARFTPALGVAVLTPLYDRVIPIFTREAAWRAALVAQIDPLPGDRILDIGCGTGSLAIQLKRREPGVAVLGLDPDPLVLARARAKAARAGLDIRFAQGFVTDASGDGFGPITKITTSLVLHQVPLKEKRRILVTARHLLGPGGTLHVADYGVQRTRLMRVLFRNLVQRVDGFADTEPNARGVLPELMRAAGFTEVEETASFATPTGSISLWRARIGQPFQGEVGALSPPRRDRPVGGVKGGPAGGARPEEPGRAAHARPAAARGLSRQPAPSSHPMPRAGGSRSRRIGLLCLLVTAVGWGLNWPVMKFLLEEWPPLSARGFAGMTAAFGLGLLAALRGERLAVPAGARARLLAAAALNVTAWMGLATLSLLWLGAGQGALLTYTMPIWATLLAWPILGQRPTAVRVLALVLGVAGVSVLLGGGGEGAGVGTGMLPGVAAALGAAVLFALGTVALRGPLGLPPLAATAWQVGLGCLPMVAVGLLWEGPDPAALSAAGWAAMAYMTAVPMGACYLCWFAALRRLPPAGAAVATLLTPLVGTVAAALTLGEPLGAREILALALTLGGVSLALRRA
jgi:drug/metabolite transporter (DMT)-like permease/ubiquinone/menaquinone biosynthesis C-methylase UbiE